MGPPEGSRWLAHNLSRVGVFCFTPSKCEGRVCAVTVSNSMCLLEVFKPQPSYRNNTFKWNEIHNSLKYEFPHFLNNENPICQSAMISSWSLMEHQWWQRRLQQPKPRKWKGFSLKLKAPFLWPHHGSHCAASLPLVRTTSTRLSSESKCWQLGEKQPTQPSAALYKRQQCKDLFQSKKAKEGRWGCRHGVGEAENSCSSRGLHASAPQWWKVLKPDLLMHG